MKRFICGALAVAWLFGCADQTSVFIEISSPLVVPDEVDHLEILAQGERTGAMFSRQFELSGAFPQSFSLQPKSDRDEAVLVTITGLKAEGDELSPVVRRSIHTTFRAGHEVVLAVELGRECVGTICPVGVDCIAGRCIRGEMDAGPDAAMPDTGPFGDARADAGLDGDAMRDVPRPVDCTSDTTCDDRDPCNGRERCELGVCVSPGTPECDDGVPCTADGCEDGVCVYAPMTSLCALGDTCDPVLGCSGRECDDASDCDDGMLCNGRESCEAGQCQTLAPPMCDDGVACTADRCDETAGGCVHEPRNGACDDGLYCNGAETCSASGCAAGTAPACDDANACTTDACDETVLTCTHAGRDADGDGHFDRACAPLAGADDCDDGNPSVRPGVPDLCAGTDDDCDGTVDDDCIGACDQTCASTTVRSPGGRWSVPFGASSTTMGSCGGVGPEARIAFRLDLVSDVLVLTHGTDVDTVTYVRACGCDGAEIGCNDDADGLNTSVLRFRSLPPGTYTVIVDTAVPSTTVPQARVDIYISRPGAPGDDCGNAVRLMREPMSGNTCSAGNDNMSTCGGGAGASTLVGPDRVYYMVFEGDTRPMQFDTCTGCTNFDTTLDVRRVCTDTRTTERISCNDDSCRSSCGTAAGNTQSRISVNMGGGMYFLTVDSKTSACGDYVVSAVGM